MEVNKEACHDAKVCAAYAFDHLTTLLGTDKLSKDKFIREHLTKARDNVYQVIEFLRTAERKLPHEAFR